jgi:hypothetical protein
MTLQYCKRSQIKKKKGTNLFLHPFYLKKETVNCNVTKENIKEVNDYFTKYERYLPADPHV